MISIHTTRELKGTDIMEIKDRWVMMPNAMAGKIKDEEGNYFLPNISNEAVALYYILVAGAGLKSTSITNLGYLLSDFKYASSTLKEQIPVYQRALQELQELGYIELYNEELEPIEDTSKLTKTTAFRYSIAELDGNYFKADINDMETIMEYMSDNKMRSRANLIRYYMVLQRKTNHTRIGTKDVVGNEIGGITGKEAQALTGITAKTFTEYNEILSELEIYHISNKHVTPKTFKSASTRFVRAKYMSKAQFEVLVDREMKSMGNIPVSKEVTRERISRSMIKHHKKNKQAQEPLMELEQKQIVVEVQEKVMVEVQEQATKRLSTVDDFEF